MSSNDSQKVGPTKTSRRWRRCILWSLGGVVLGIAGALLYPPAFRSVARLVVWNEARARGVEISVGTTEGSIFEPLVFRNIRAWRSLPGHADAEIHIAYASVRLAPLRLFTHAGRGWLRRVVVDDMQLSVRWGPTASAASARPVRRLPALLSKTMPAAIEAHHVRCRFSRNHEELRCDDMTLIAGDAEAGHLTIGRAALRLPGFQRQFRALNGSATLQNGALKIAALSLQDDFTFRTVTVSLSDLLYDGLFVEFDASAFAGILRGTVRNVPGQPALELEAAGSFEGIDLARLAVFLGLNETVGGVIREGRFSFQGAPRALERAAFSTRVEVANFRWGKRQWDELVLGFTVANRRVRLPEFELKQARNRLAARGEAALPAVGRPWWEAEVSLQFDASVENLAELSALAGAALADARGQLRALGSLSGSLGSCNGSLELTGEELSYRGAPVGNISATVSLNGAELQVSRIELRNGNDFLEGRGSLTLGGEWNYAAELKCSIANLQVYAPLLRPPIVPGPLAGGMTLDWSGDGSRQFHSGAFTLQLKKAGALVGDGTLAGPINASLEGTYAPGNVHLARCELSRGAQRASATVTVGPHYVHLAGIEARFGGRAALNGEALLPLDVWSAWPERRWIADGKTLVRCTGAGVPLAELSRWLGLRWSLDGALVFDLDVAGPLRDLQGSAELRLENGTIDGSGPFTARAVLNEEGLAVSAQKMPWRLAQSVEARFDLEAVASRPFDTGRLAGQLRLVGLKAPWRLPLDQLLDPLRPLACTPVPVQAAPFAAWDLDVVCQTPRPLRIDGQPGEIDAVLRITGKAGAPHLAGVLTARNLECASPVAAFQINTASLFWNADSFPDALLEAAVSGKTGTFRFTGLVIGSTRSRTAILESEPALPADELFARLQGAPSPVFLPQPLFLAPGIQPSFPP